MVSTKLILFLTISMVVVVFSVEKHNACEYITQEQ